MYKIHISIRTEWILHVHYVEQWYLPHRQAAKTNRYTLFSSLIISVALKTIKISLVQALYITVQYITVEYKLLQYIIQYRARFRLLYSIQNNCSV
jgi:hypothetical protein